MGSVPNDEVMVGMYRDDPELALAMLNDILKDGEPYELLIVLRQLSLSFGGVQAVAEKAGLNPTQLYRTLSPRGNPKLSTLLPLLKALGLQLSVQPAQSEAASYWTGPAGKASSKNCRRASV